MASRRIQSYNIAYAGFFNDTGTIDPNFDQIFGVKVANLILAVDGEDNTPDNGSKSDRFWIRQATVTVEGGYMDHQAIETVTGSPILEYANKTAYEANQPLDRQSPTYQDDLQTAVDNGTYVFSQLLWAESGLNPLPKPMLLRMAAQDTLGSQRVQDIVIFRFEFITLNILGPAFATGMSVNYTGRAVMSELDERGVPLGNMPSGLPIRSLAKWVNYPAV